MKKLLLSIAFMLSAIPANATNWHYLGTENSLFIDEDTIQYIDDNIYYYAIRFQKQNAQEQVAYIKSNSDINYIGIIQTGDWDETKYNPDAVFFNPHVFMKPIDEKSFLNTAHRYVVNDLANENFALQNGLREKNLKQISYVQLEEYTKRVAIELNSNWNPPSSARNTTATITLTLGIDGSLQNYKFKKSSGDKTTDRSIISAVEKTVPFIKIPRYASKTEVQNFDFTFNKYLINKSVE